MKRTSIFCVFFIIIAGNYNLQAQATLKNYNNWIFGHNAGVSFSSGLPVAFTSSAMNQLEGCVSISDNSGSLLFYSDGTKVWNKNNVQMTNGFGLLGGNSSSQAALVVPKPGTDSIYYLFTANENTGGGGLSYSEININLNSGLGDVVVATKNTNLVTPIAERLTATRHANGIDYWVVVHEWLTNKFYAYLVTSAGVNATPVVSATGSVYNGFLDFIGCMKISPDGSKIASAISRSHIVELLDFNDSSGVVSNPISLSFSDNTYGVSFSPGSCKLYVPTFGNELFQFNLFASDIAASKTLVGSVNSAGILSSIQIAPNGKIYIARNAIDSLDVINCPDKLGIACNYSANEIYLEGRICGNGLPNCIDNIFSGLGNCNIPFSIGQDTSICYGDSIIISAPNSSKYFWNNGDTTQNIIADSSGFFWVLIQDTFGCKQLSDSIYVSVLAIPSITQSNVVCKGDSVSLFIFGGNTYLWSNGDTNDSIRVLPIVDSWYAVSVTEGTCSTNDSVFVYVNLLPEPSSQIINVLCFGDSSGSASISVQGITPFLYNWLPYGGSDSFANNLIAGNFVITISDSIGCDTTLNINISEPSLLASFISDSILPICFGDSNGLITVRTNGGVEPYFYLWSNNTIDSTAINLMAGFYYVIVTDSNSCVDSVSLNLTQPQEVIAGIGLDTNICFGDTLQLLAQGGDSYLWSDLSIDSTIFVFGDSDRIYWVIATVDVCSDTTSINVSVQYNPVAKIIGLDSTCKSDLMVLTANGNGAYLWSTGETDSVITIIASMDTAIYLTVTNNCSFDIDSINIAVYNPPAITSSNDTSIIYGNGVSLFISGGGLVFNWTPSTNISCTYCNNPIVNPTSSTTYSGTSIDSNGCIVLVDITISILEYDCDTGLIFIPNAFSPNSDGLNDEFKILGNDFEIKKLVIYNRWGNLVYSTTSNNGWDGKHLGELAEIGVYIYYMEAECTSLENLITRKGNVVLIR